MTSAPPNHRVQSKAKEVMLAIARTITSHSNERTIANTAKSLLTDSGLTDTWYYDCPAFVLLGSRTCLSMSGRDYVPADEPVGSENLVTIDLSPRDGDVWGDYARSLCVENGQVVEAPGSTEFQDGLNCEAALHQRMIKFVTPNTTFHELYEFANDAISSGGFENLDFLGNVGHSIATRRDDRLYVEKGNHRRISEVPCFTFEPHIRRKGGRWGFKHEDIYFFSHDQCVAV